MSGIDEYKGERLTVINDGKRCIHSRYCVLNLPFVFKPNVDGPWIEPKCCDGGGCHRGHDQMPVRRAALPARRRDGARRPTGCQHDSRLEDGPLAVHAELNVGGDTSSHRATLCRCGRSFNKPYCDRMHMKAGFKATGEPESGEAKCWQSRTVHSTSRHKGWAAARRGRSGDLFCERAHDHADDGSLALPLWSIEE